MIDVEKWATIRSLAREGYGKKTIARMLGISRNTVRRALEGDKPPRYVREKQGETKLDPYKEKARHLYLDQDLIGTRIFNDLTAEGYTGSITTLYRYLTQLDKNHRGKVTVRFETAPGVQAQFDWSPYKVDIAGKEQNVYCYLLVLSYSRYKYMTFSADQTTNSVVEALEEALRFWGGAPQTILIDNAKQMVFETLPNNVKRFNETLLMLAGMYSFKPVACRIRCAKTKGKVERPFFYIEQHFIKGRTFTSMEDLIEKGHRFIAEWNQREHMTTLRPPVELLPLDLAKLSALPGTNLTETMRELRKVSWDCLVSVKGSRYSVPHQYAGKRVWIKTEHGHLLTVLSLNGAIIAQHELSKQKGSTNINSSHYEGLNPTPQSAPRIREVFYAHFPSGEQFFQGLQERVTCNAPYHAQKILLLREYYADETIELAIQKALTFKAFSHSAVCNILKQHPFKEMALPLSPKKVPKAGSEPRPLSYYGSILH